MQINLHLHPLKADGTSTDLGLALSEIYAFLPYRFTSADGSTLDSVIDASHDLTPDQIAVLQNNKYEISFVLPATPSTPATSEPLTGVA